MTLSLDKDTISSLNEMMRAFYERYSNDYITIIGGYRSYDEQMDKYYNGNSEFSGGFSDYHSGRLFDMGIFPKDGTSDGYYTATGDYAWIDDNAARYGFILRYPEGKEDYTGEKAKSYTYRYVGVPHAYYIKQNNLCLEEYIEAVKGYTVDNPLKVNVDKNSYSIYYVAASAEKNTEIPIISENYTISGNNSDGFIITINE